MLGSSDIHSQMPRQRFLLSYSETPIFDLGSHPKGKRYALDPLLCDECNVSFTSLKDFETHMNLPEHLNDYYDPVPTGSCYCGPCDRRFSDVGALNRHRTNSPKHVFRSYSHPNWNDEREFKCVFCNGMFKSPSAVALHVESGCHKFTRHHVTAAVHSLQIVPTISVKTITGSVNPPESLQSYFATEASFNGTKYECCLCNKKFRTLKGLNAHLNSPAHDDDEFRCPKCKTHFKLISGLIQHLESHACGLAERPQIANQFHGLVDQFSCALKL